MVIGFTTTLVYGLIEMTMELYLNFNDNFQWESRDWYALGECTLSLDAVEPIEITDEWLIAFAFKKENYGLFLKTKDKVFKIAFL
jgi:hypothetical protein